MSNDIRQINNLRDYLARTKGERYPLAGHPLEQANGHIKNLYFKMLGMIMDYVPQGMSREQDYFFQRLTKGCKTEYSVRDYLRQGLEVSPEEFERFAADLRTGKLVHTFLLDALLLVHLEEPAKEMVELLAELAESLLVNPKELEALAHLCRSILTQSAAQCLFWDWKKENLGVRTADWAVYCGDSDPVVKELKEDGCYILAANRPCKAQLATVRFTGKQYVHLSSIFDFELLGMPGGNFYCDGYYANIPRTFSVASVFANLKYVCFYNLEINLEERAFFDSIGAVKFVNCKFTGQDVSIYFSNCSSIQIQSCSFENFNRKLFICHNVQTMSIENSTFAHCIEHYDDHYADWAVNSSLVYDRSGTMQQLSLTKSYFTDCGAENRAYYFSSAVLSNAKAIIRDCVFELCWHYNRNSRDKRDPADPKRCLFNNIISESGNKLIDSAELKPH